MTETEEASEAAAETEVVMDAVPGKKDTESDKGRGKTGRMAQRLVEEKGKRKRKGHSEIRIEFKEPWKI